MSMKQTIILLVEDDEDLSMITSLQLEGEGYQVYCAKSGAEAKVILKEQRLDLILLDVMLPDCTGHELCTYIRESYDYPIIFMSCLGDSDTIVQSFREGGDDYLVKPVDIEELNQRIAANLDKKQDLEIRIYKQFMVDTQLREVYQHLEDDSQGERIELSPTEYKLLLTFINKPKQILLYRELYREIWEQGEIEDIRTLMVHVSNLRKKLDWQKRDSFKAVRSVGYIFNDL